jgi:septum formation topological specificity factor MinE
VILTKTEVDLKLIILGERTLAVALYRKAEAVRKKKILEIVQRHIRASADELKERLMEVMINEVEFTQQQKDEILAKLVP